MGEARDQTTEVKSTQITSLFMRSFVHVEKDDKTDVQRLGSQATEHFHTYLP
jgi:hypothetical protein